MKQLFHMMAICICALSGCAAEKDITPTRMNLDTFTHVTINVVKADGIDEYLPTIVLLDINQIRVLEGIPEDVKHTDAIQNTISRSGYESREFMFGVLSSSGVITVGHFRPNQATHFMQIIAIGDDYQVSELDYCPWWKIENK